VCVALFDLVFSEHLVMTWIIGTGLLIGLGWWLIGVQSAQREVYEVFNVDPQRFRLVGSDLGGRRPMYLRMGNLVGAPDAAFRSRRDKHGVIGEFKSRRYRGFIRRRERYQCILYMGMLKHCYRLHSVSAVLRFADQCVDIPYDEMLFNHLVAIGPELQQARKRWKAPNPQPLHQR
jgi:hypothetical protein